MEDLCALNEIWVVIEPSAGSELADVCFATDLHGLALQIRGGLTPEELKRARMYLDERAAKAEAARRLEARRAYDAAFDG